MRVTSNLKVYTSLFVTIYICIQTDIEATRQVFTSRIPVVLLPSNVTCSVSVTSYLNSREGTNGLFSTIFDCNDDFLFKASMKVISRYKLFLVALQSVYHEINFDRLKCYIIKVVNLIEWLNIFREIPPE